jgi:hypothetical protein
MFACLAADIVEVHLLSHSLLLDEQIEEVCMIKYFFVKKIK